MIIVICLFIAGVIILLCITVKTKRQKISVLIGFAATVFSFFAFTALLFLFKSEILLLLLIFYVSLIVFLILWNKIKTKKVYLLLLVPGLCVLTAITIIGYDSYIREIPTVSEESYSTYRYMPFIEDNKLAKPDGKSHLRLFDNLPVLDGATALYPVYASFAQAVYSEDEYKASKGLVLCSKTPEAYENLLKNKADIIFCLAPSDGQKKQFHDNGVNLKLVPIGKEAFVFFVNKKNIVDNVTIGNIQGIYSGKIRNWEELNGANRSIRAFQRPKNSGSQTALERIMGDIPIVEPRREDVATEMGGIINQVAVYRNFPNAIGYSFLFYSTEMVKNDQIKLLSIEGVYPSRETIQNGSYPFSNTFYAIYITENKNENIDLFIEWILSRQGQELIEKTGYTPIKEQ